MREGWTYKKLEEVASFTSGSRPSGGVRAITHGVLSLGGEHIGKNGYIDLSTPKYVSEQYYMDNNKGHLKDGDILLCKDGALSGKVALVRNELQGVAAMVNEHVFIIRTDAISQPFLFTFFFSPIGQTELKSRITGAAQGGINGTNLKTIIVPIPPHSEQQRIVSELDLLSSIIEKKKAQLKEYDQLAQSIFYDMFGDPVTNEKGWEVKTIKDLVAKEKNSLKRGPFGGALKKDIFVENGYLVYEQYHALNNDYTFGRYFISEEKYKEMIDFSVKEGDIIISCSGVNLGKLSIIPSGANKGIINQALLKLTLNKSIFSNIFFVYIFQEKTFKEKYFGDNRGCAIPNMPPMSEFKKIKYICPPLSLQQSFAEKIEAIEQQKALILQSITETETLFNSRMDYYFN